MNKRAFAAALCAAVIQVGAGGGALAESDPSVAAGGSHDDWTKDVTVLTIAPDGTWGVGTEAFINGAIAQAIADCKRKYRGEIGCGYRQVSIRAGWSLVFRCGSENIIVAEPSLAAAEQMARTQEYELRAKYVPNMPACVRTVTVDPRGMIASPVKGYSAAPQIGR